MKILSLCGSIREGSSSGLLLNAFRSLLPAETQWNSVELKALPYFDPSHQFESVPELIAEIREITQSSDYIVIATPEYAHGIPGILKNGLEWLICEETMKKKVVLFIVSPSGGEYVLQYLTETLRTMDLLPSDELTMVINNARSQLSADGSIDLNLKNSLIELSQRLRI
ncbi:NADPH-dependent FMN reductase [Bdellovibrio sp. KM01]|uniref:NADPH-dependent FMN reductase n=1 Tax=Bdellovibrio sp. KM01 TaxID=2748865 RepID=UPI0015E949AB|nr:NADPH-dependent FMN reductase [Bdellovibrio sp. KM01]QLY26885.1 NAD(P)H-dependent oxidoreductase [Bdellovibrio sp. KM01]